MNMKSKNVVKIEEKNYVQMNVKTENVVKRRIQNIVQIMKRKILCKKKLKNLVN